MTYCLKFVYFKRTVLTCQTTHFVEADLCPYCFPSVPAFIGHVDNHRETSGSIYKQSTPKFKLAELLSLVLF